ncbi:MAG TPA: hypothetical protein VFT43_06165 [Candidatus Polarisedimenticolia bacterium]|nr:hypothetical protein [Candidatus Polarisedimenticolia bacterium]
MERKKVVVDLQQIDLLEQKIVKATELIRSLRREKETLVAKAREAQEALAQARALAAASEKDRKESQEIAEQLEVLQEERVAIRGKVSRMLEMMAGLDEVGVEGRREH